MPGHTFTSPENHHAGRGLGEGGDEGSEAQENQEGVEEVGTSRAAGPWSRVAEAANAGTLSVVLHKVKVGQKCVPP